MDLINDRADQYAIGDEVNVKSGDMVYRRGMVMNFSPGSGDSVHPGSVDNKYHDTNELEKEIPFYSSYVLTPEVTLGAANGTNETPGLAVGFTKGS